MFRKYLSQCRSGSVFSRESRGQTLQDFAVGASLFLFTILLVFAFIPSMFAPFTFDSSAGGATQIDRAADELLSTLTVQDSQVTLDATCTVAFFSNTTNNDCGYTAEPVTDTLSLPETASVHVSIEDSSGDVVTYDGTSLERGESVPETHNKHTVVRHILLDGEQHLLRITIW